MSVKVDIQYATDIAADEIQDMPSAGEFGHWVNAALDGKRMDAELTIRVVGLAEGTQLNETYRRRQGPTNVLSFPFESPPDLTLPLLGDIVICAPLVAKEAHEQGEESKAHWAHLAVHGTLHLIGYDHEVAEEAEVMERLESEILLGLGYPDPYADERLAALIM